MDKGMGMGMGIERHDGRVTDEDVTAEVVAELYALDRGDFIAARDEAAARRRADGDKASAAAVKKLARPTVAAWALNQLVRANPGLVGRLTELGEQLRTAQSSLDAARLKALRPTRDALLAEAGHAAATVAAARGQSLDAAADEVRGALVAALADEAAAEALLSGRLVRALSYAGFGEAQLNAAAAPHAPEPAAQKPAAQEPAVQRAAQKRAAQMPAAQKPAAQKPAGQTPGAQNLVAQQSAQRQSGAPEGEQRRERDPARAVELAAHAVEAAEHALWAAEEEATATGLARARAEHELTAARRRTAEFRGLLERAERAQAAAGDDLDSAGADWAEADRRVAEAAAAWDAAKQAQAALG